MRVCLLLLTALVVTALVVTAGGAEDVVDNEQAEQEVVLGVADGILLLARLGPLQVLASLDRDVEGLTVGSLHLQQILLQKAKLGGRENDGALPPGEDLRGLQVDAAGGNRRDGLLSIMQGSVLPGGLGGDGTLLSGARELALLQAPFNGGVATNVSEDPAIEGMAVVGGALIVVAVNGLERSGGAGGSDCPSALHRFGTKGHTCLDPLALVVLSGVAFHPALKLLIANEGLQDAHTLSVLLFMRLVDQSLEVLNVVRCHLEGMLE